MSFSIFHKYGLDKIHDSLTEDYDYKDNDSNKWQLVDKKSVRDSDGFLTEYAWYTDGNVHIFMFGDTDITEPDEDYADWVAESKSQAADWFNNYHGFEEDDIWDDFEEDDYDNDFSGNSHFMNDAFDRIYGNGSVLED